ncbi:hypothetical protein Tco_0647776 [Tanacetum coccineum]
MSGSPTPSPDPVVESLSPSFTPFRDNDFLLEEIDAFLSLDDSIPPGTDNGIYDSKGDILFLEELLNEDPTLNLPPIPYPVCLINETEKIKSSIDDPLDVELKDLPPHLEYAYLEGTSKLPVIIAKDLKREEKEQLLKVLKSHKRALAWKISHIRGIDLNFFTHKILMKDDFKPTVQHQRRVGVFVLTTENGFSGYFQIPIDPQDQDKTTFTCPYGTFAYQRMPFGLCNALGRSKGVWNLLLKFVIKKGAKNLAADHLRRLENPYQGDRLGIEINDNFPHESLNMISLNPDNEPPWFADIANYLVGNVLVKGMSS